MHVLIDVRGMRKQRGSQQSAREVPERELGRCNAGVAAGRLRLGLQAVQPTWSYGVQGNRTLHTFPINTQNCIKEIPGCHHQHILPAKTILARPSEGPASQAKSQQYVQYKFLHLPIFHHLPHSPHQLAIPKVTVEVRES